LAEAAFRDAMTLKMSRVKSIRAGMKSCLAAIMARALAAHK
jgi:hypothetical protein